MTLQIAPTASDPINNMNIYSLAGMDDEGACLLCEKLCEGEGVHFSNKNKVIKRVLEKTNNLPFFIQPHNLILLFFLCLQLGVVPDGHFITII